MSITILFLVTGLILILITDKNELHLSANAFVGGSADSFFALYTHIGDGITVAILVLLLSLIKPRKFLPVFSLGITTFALSGLISQFFKRIVFPHQFRPTTIFGAENLNLIEGVKLHGSFSFPSGHSTVSFALFIFVAFIFRKYRWVQIIAAFMAILAAYSRVHISQHFIEDVVAGALLGVSSFYLFHWLYNTYVFKGKLLD